MHRSEERRRRETRGTEGGGQAQCEGGGSTIDDRQYMGEQRIVEDNVNVDGNKTRR